ncbi:MAG: MBOAT family protein [Clostridiales bacterium]|nr:MBOAT family protein [Eubacteriales bacterium]MDD4709923.1 MBOAT family protein [Eubacteriales bacterium]NLO14723.1 MBOAT family protein [Clostridiales bacterium]
MVFSSTVFLLLFLPLTLFLYYNPIFKSRSFRNHTLLLASLVFYAWGEPVFVLVLLISILVNWFFALMMDRQTDAAKRKRFLIFPISFDIGLLFLFKYLGFTLSNLGLLLGGTAVQFDIALPIGISFFTFQAMSYVVDVYRKRAPIQRNVLNVALYITLFPQLIAGPIVRYETVADQIMNRRETPADFTAGVTRFIFGLGKKVLLANYVGLIADNIFATGNALSVASAWLGIVSYALQIYFDFSGYSDMAIGLGSMFGFHFLENFNFPYIANSITDFWRRWHISLGTWFRDYVYIPLGGNRVSKSRWIFNVFAVWLLTGIWHGANWTFVVWGLYYFAFLVFERLTGFHKKLGILSHVYTLFVVLVGWVIFRAESLPRAIQYLGYMFGVADGGFMDNFFRYYVSNGKWVLLAAAACSVPAIGFIRNKLSAKTEVSSEYPARSSLLVVMDVGKTILTVLIFALSLLVSVNSTYNPFIYFNF